MKNDQKLQERTRRARLLERQARAAQAQRGLHTKPMAYFVRRALAEWSRFYPAVKA